MSNSNDFIATARSNPFQSIRTSEKLGAGNYKYGDPLAILQAFGIYRRGLFVIDNYDKIRKLG
jgi:hypothetical protein